MQKLLFFLIFQEGYPYSFAKVGECTHVVEESSEEGEHSEEGELSEEGESTGSGESSEGNLPSPDNTRESSGKKL
jgi:hypothetical protein